MNIPRLNIHSINAKINMKITQPELNIQNGKSELSIEQPKEDMEITRTPSQLIIDQTEAWHNLNLASSAVRTRDIAGYSRQAVMEGIARRAQEGDDLMHIERGGNPIAEHARQDSIVQSNYSIGKTPPDEAVKINYDPSKVDISWQPHKPVINASTTPPSYHLNRGEVMISMERYPSVEITVVDNKVNELI